MGIRYLLIYVLILTLSLTFGNSCNNNTTSGRKSSNLPVSADTAIISFREYEHDFGEVTEGEKVACIFTFENTGKGPLVILSVTTTCGCTVPKYDSKPILPGGNGIVEVVFDTSGKVGMQSKTITVRSNASKSIVLLKISAEVKTSNNN
jgi:hypothetical protein